MTTTSRLFDSSMTYVALNGHIVSLSEARISPEDRGFRFGDGAFETIRVTKGRPYLLHAHLKRLEEGLQILQIHASLQDAPSLATALIEKNQVTEGVLRIAVSRGEGSRGYLPLGKQNPTVYVTALSMPDEEMSPRHLIVSQYKKPSPDALPTHTKHANGLGSILARLEAEATGADDALMLSAAGFVSETSSANLFWQKDGKTYTPALSTGCLNGIMRQRFMQLFPGILECESTLEELLQAEAVLMTNSAYYVTSVAVIAGKQIPASEPLYREWRARIEKDISQSFAE